MCVFIDQAAYLARPPFVTAVDAELAPRADARRLSLAHAFDCSRRCRLYQGRKEAIESVSRRVPSGFRSIVVGSFATTIAITIVERDAQREGGGGGDVESMEARNEEEKRKGCKERAVSKKGEHATGREERGNKSVISDTVTRATTN